MQMAGEMCFFGALLLGVAFFVLSMQLVEAPSLKKAKMVLFASVACLSLLLGLILGDCLV